MIIKRLVVMIITYFSSVQDCVRPGGLLSFQAAHRLLVCYLFSTAIGSFTQVIDLKPTFSVCDNFVASLTKLISSRPRDSSETFLLGKLVGHRAQSPVR